VLITDFDLPHAQVILTEMLWSCNKLRSLNIVDVPETLATHYTPELRSTTAIC